MPRTTPGPAPGQETYAARDTTGRLVIALLDPNQPHSPLHRALRNAHLEPETPPVRPPRLTLIEPETDP
ncbi:hypothetical protein [Streptomyces olivaceiscleroticus]|uniref:Uncharacterized protein n=1 Tax=Streptomyces olivaceiscleroticus TaxID=68245 RepID=A0ABP3LLK3_9ACTN